MRTPSPSYCRLDLAPPLADRFISGWPPSIAARYFSSCPSDSTSRWTPCPPENRRLVASGPPWLVSGFRFRAPFRLLHTFHLLRPARGYPRVWIWRPSFGRQMDFNPPEQCAAQRTLRGSPPLVRRIGTFGLAELPLGPFPLLSPTRFSSSVRKPG